MPKVVIVGGGPAGLACAAELNSRGISVTLLERREVLGGRVEALSCKGLLHCRQCDVCRVHRLRREVLASPYVTVHHGVELQQVERDGGRYRFDLLRFKRAIDPGLCSLCGKCVEACPTGAMAKVGGRIVLDRQACRSIQGLECERCVSVCPTAAIDLFGEEHISVQGEAVVVATGSLEFPAEREPRLGWKEVPGVMTSMELEAVLEGRAPWAMAEGSSVAFLLCVGSRTCLEGTPMCSSICCRYALRQALTLKEMSPSLKVTMFVMDWRGMARDDPLLEELDCSDLRVVRSRPAEVREDGGRPTAIYAADGAIVQEGFDHLVLVLGLVPDLENELARHMALPRDALGNLTPSRCRERGIFMAGSCLGPKDIKHCVVDGVMAARKAMGFLEGGDE
ncbi:MAG: CoB--CoM heterodisulfide reductase iron-sulfur subunit A family protein [Methanomassiliicoccales archaeon]|nr:CoB--CoM heterodisulfide reductase iron-sulfur subunit A family protein [Methanomassiliicoccales archaeon]